MKKILFCLCSAVALYSCTKSDTAPVKSIQTQQPAATALRGDLWDTYPESDSAQDTTIYHVPLTNGYVTGLEQAIAQDNSAVVAFLESSEAAAVVAYIPDGILGKMKDPAYLLVTRYEYDGEQVVAAKAKVIIVATGNVETAVNLRL